MIYSVKSTAKEFEKIVRGSLEGKDCKIKGISIDSREVGDAWCFIAIKGKNNNGHEYISQAVSNGACLIIAQEKVNTKIPVIYVSDTVKALGLLAKFHKGKAKVIAVTGSVGKTTVKNMLISVLSKHFSVCGTEKNHNNEIGVAQTLLSIKNEDYCVVEMGMRQCGQIDWLAYIAEPYIAIITNCTDAHLELLKSRENIFNAKMEILNYSPEYAFVPFENRFLEYKYTNTKVTFLGDGSDCFIFNQENDGLHLTFQLNTGECYLINSIFECNAYNALFVHSVAKLLKVPYEKIVQGFSEFVNDDNREKIIKINNTIVINDCYNASYESMKSAIASCAKYAKCIDKKLYLLLGDMLELGEESGEFHKKIGKFARKSGVRALYLVGKYAGCVAEGFGGKQAYFYDDSMIKDILKETDNGVLLVKASRTLQLEKIIERLKQCKDD